MNKGFKKFVPWLVQINVKAPNRSFWLNVFNV